jgi:hypothetical protein
VPAAAVPRRDQAVADHPIAPDPLDRRSREHLAETGIVEREQVGQHRRGKLGARREGQSWPGRQRRTCSTGRRRGNRRSHRCGCPSLAEFERDRAFVLDREIGDAAPRIEPVRRRKGIGRACGLAGVAASARRPAGVVGQVERGVDRAEEQPAAVARLTRLVCLPCQPSPAASASGFSITGAVSTNTLTSAPGAAPTSQRASSFSALDHVVIVGALRIDRDAAALPFRGQRQWIDRRGVAHPERDHRAHLGP